MILHYKINLYNFILIKIPRINNIIYIILLDIITVT